MGVDTVPARRGLRATALVLALVTLQAVWLAVSATPPEAVAQEPGPPNIVLIVTDDQRFDTLQVMPEVQRLLMGRGMTLRRAIASNPLCCPSRAAILTGRFSHTTGVYTNVAPAGSWTAFQPSESDTIATALHDAGYRTALIGKYFNGYVGDDVYVPPGWDRWFGLVGTGRYYHYSVYDDVHGLVSYGGLPKEYSTDVIRRKAVSFIRSAPTDTPLFLMVTPFAPHTPFVAARRHEGTRAFVPVRLGPAVNEADVSDKPEHISGRATVSEEWVRARTRDQWESLTAVDELVSRIVAVLEETGRGEDTLLIFTSDNGLSNAEHRWHVKQVPYEESIRVPLVIRLPGEIPEHTLSDALVSNVDLAPTIADFAGVSLAADGVSLRPLLTDTASSVRDAVLLEHVQSISTVPTYCGVRTPSFLFVHYATGEEELYDLVNDPKQLQNVVSSRPRKATSLRALTESLCQPVPPGFAW